MQQVKPLTLWRKYLNNYKIDSNLKHDSYALKCCTLALEAAESGNVGVGAILLDQYDNVVIQGKNSIFSNGFHSDLHAEMVVMNSFEKKQTDRLNLSGYTLFSSLEPCPMCLVRLIFSGIGRVFFVCPDNDGGMVRHIKNLPPIFQKFIRNQQQIWSEAVCSDDLKNMSNQIWIYSRRLLDQIFE